MKRSFGLVIFIFATLGAPHSFTKQLFPSVAHNDVREDERDAGYCRVPARVTAAPRVATTQTQEMYHKTDGNHYIRAGFLRGLLLLLIIK